MRSFVLLGCLFVAGLRATAATYYVDHASGSDANPGTAPGAPWKLCPGMPGFAGTFVHTPGDRFVFKGGVTWPSTALPLVIAFSGASGARDTYTADRAWYAGAIWSPPTLDGGHAGGPLLGAAGRTHFSVSDLRLIDAGTARVANGAKCLVFEDCAEFTLANNTIASESWIGIYIYAVRGGTRRNVTLTGNDISACAMGVVVATTAPNAIYDNVDLVGNHFHDFASQIGDGVHGDGIHIWGQDQDSSQHLTNLRIRNNRFGGSFARTFGASGGMTALIYIENATAGAEIFNNVLTYSDPPTDGMFEALISLRANNGHGGGHRIHQNVFTGTTPGMSAAIVMGDGPNNAVPRCDVRNNVFNGMQFGLYIAAGSESGLICDYNVINATSAPAFYVSEFLTMPELRAIGINEHGREVTP